QNVESAPQQTETDATAETAAPSSTETTSNSNSVTEPPPQQTEADEPAETAAPSSTETTSNSNSVTEPPPQGLTEVHIIGTKYIDYFTDGTTITSYPGDPEIHAHIAEPNAPIPTHEGLTWVHSVGNYLYDTESGDLEEGQYADF